MTSSPLSVIDCPPAAPGPLMRVAGMYVAERLARERLRAGDQVQIRASQETFDRLAVAGAQRLEPTAPVPASATLLAATELAGVELADERSRRQAEWQLMQSCRRPYDGLADTYLLRAFSLRLSRFLTRFPIRPNHVTALSTLCGLATCFLLAAFGAHRWALSVAGATIITAIILDSVDGELARVRHMGSHLGMWLDNLADDVVDTSLLVCMGLAVGGSWLPVAIAAAGARAFAALVTYRGAARLGHPGDVMAFRWWFDTAQETTEVYENRFTPLTLLRSLGRRDMYITVYAVAFAAGAPYVALGLGMTNGLVQGVMALLHLFLNKHPAVARP